MTNFNALPQPTWHHLGVNAMSRRIPEPGWEGLLPADTVLTPEKARSGAFPPDDGACGGMGCSFEKALSSSPARQLFVRLGADMDEPVVIRHRADSPLTGACVHIACEEGGNFTVYEILEGEGSYAGCLHLRCSHGAHVHLVQILAPHASSRVWSSLHVSLEDSSGCDVTRIIPGCRTAAAGALASLRGAGSSFSLHALYLGKGNECYDFNDVVRHTARDTRSFMHTAGVLDEEAFKTLRGTIDFRRGSEGASGRETEDVLLFSDKVRNLTAPLILCEEERVDGQHAASIGRVSAEDMYYCQSRGLTESAARSLLARAKLEPVLSRIGDPFWHDRIARTIDERMKQFA